ncbi:MAG: 5-formyltetrahydrofolate cyclo-ligase [Zoogloeaceae bacterium]|jgi:5,10-methenyltetrahydrofolate synthetase|nr:5-formyltetrahydrofolate cyclo-ligase [Zoogloeaceae bacterium]
MESPLIDQKTAPARQTARQILRQRMARARTRLTPEQGAALSARLVTHLLAHFPAPPGRCIAFCWPIKNEPDIRAALEHWRAQGAVAALPVVTAAGQPLAFRAWTPATPLAPDRYGIPTPTAGDWLCPDALLIPLNAFDAQGYRLGYGGGFFDRTLAVWTPRPLTLGVGFELNRLASIEPEAHDLPLDWIFTEAGGERARR